MRRAFMKQSSELERFYAAVPEGTDILVSRQPPLYYGDRTFNLDTRRVEHVGSQSHKSGSSMTVGALTS
jgi:hypothetical protein